MKIGVTERGDAGLNLSWLDVLNTGQYDGAIAITKAPQNLLNVDLPDNVVVHCTITGLGGTVIEPGVARPAKTLTAYFSLVDKYGPERIVLRVDPILLWSPWINRARSMVKYTRGRVRISFMDYYKHTQKRFEDAGVDIPASLYSRNILHACDNSRFEFYEWAEEHTQATLHRSVEVCGEPGIVCTGCVSLTDIYAMGLDADKLSGRRAKQRLCCACITEKTEMLNCKGQCQHGCLYCYWRDQHDNRIAIHRSNPSL